MRIPGLAPIHLIPRRTIESAAPHGYALAIKGLPSGDYTIARYRISARKDAELIDRKREHSPLTIESDLGHPGIELVVISRGERRS